MMMGEARRQLSAKLSELTANKIVFEWCDYSDTTNEASLKGIWQKLENKEGLTRKRILKLVRISK